MSKNLKTKLSHEDEDEDAIIARIQEESLRYYNEVELPRLAAEARQEKQQPKNIPDEEPQAGSSNVGQCPKSLGTPIKDLFYPSASQGANGFHLATGDTYIYPTNYPVRKYQKNIIHSALFHNTLVSLPTGLGKTFIAAVVMFNYYRWFPQGKIVFMAPTRPLVAQQIRACHDIMAIPIKDTIEMTGTMNPQDRTQQWKNKRVFFLTPQVMANDLRNGICPAKSFKCVVIDEAHKATGEYAYCHVIKELENAGAVFRVLALSATPGSNIRAVIEVVQNLRITMLELRSEDSPDVLPYTHAKQVEPIILNLSQNIVEFREKYLLIFERYAKSLRQARLVTCNVQNFSKFQLLKASERLRARPPNGMQKAKVGLMMADFTVCMTLAHGLELLQTYGLRAFYQYFTACEDEENRKAAFTRLRQDVEFHQLMEVLSKAIAEPMDKFWSHPKHEALVRILLEHFSQTEENSKDSKVIIFCQYRVVVSEITALLSNFQPKIKPAMFIGQGVGKDKNGLPQKKQIEIMKQFREGKSNVLIATCVAEEGLDIGSVDLLVLMEVQRSPVRLIQRLGRTGRHRKGRCVVLLTHGKEVQKFHEAMATKKSFLNTIQTSNILQSSLYKNEPAMLPPNLMPKMQLVHINVPERVTPGKSKKQSDIRQALVAKLDDSEETIDTGLVNEEQADLILQEINTLKLDFNNLNFSDSQFLFHKINGPVMTPEKLFDAAEFCQQSDYNEWNRVPHQTYLISHSTDTDLLCHLLTHSEYLQTGQVLDVNSQMSYSQLIERKKHVSKPKIKNDVEGKKKKNDKEVRAGRDIRECMAAAAQKVQSSQHPKENVPSNIAEPIFLDTVIDLELSSSNCLKENSMTVENINLDLNVKESLKCSLCDELAHRVFKLNEKHLKVTSPEMSFPTIDEMHALENLVDNLTKDIIDSINVSEMFSQEFHMINLERNIAELEQKSKLISNSLCQTPLPKTSYRQDYNVPHEIEEKTNSSITKKEHIDGHNTPQLEGKTISTEHTPAKHHVCESDKEKNKEIINSPDFFGIEDIFNEEADVTLFGYLGNNSKTSTPIVKNVPLEIIEDNFSKSCSQINSNPVKNINSPILEMTQSQAKRNVFKIPKLKLSFHTNKSPASSPFLNSKNVLSSPESPILSGQVSTAIPKESPLPKVERKKLFHDHKFYENEVSVDSSILCKPLDEISVPKKDDLNNEEFNISVSQLFDDDDPVDVNKSSNVSKTSEMDQSSMFTITQMVDKVSALSRNKSISFSTGLKNVSFDKSQKENCVYTLGNKPTLDFGDDDDSIFNNIDLEAISKEKDTDMSSNEIKKSILSDNYENKAEDSAMNLGENIESLDVSLLNKKPTKNSELSSTLKSTKDSSMAVRWLGCMKPPLDVTQFKSSTPHTVIKKRPRVLSDSDSNSDVFLSPQNNKSNLEKSIKGVKKKKRKVKEFVELEADVSGAPGSSDEENTSGLDDLDQSFINDMTQQATTSFHHTTTDIQARYLQSVKSPMRKQGGFKIPTISDSVLAMDVYSQAVNEDENDSYENDSFCCDETEIEQEEDPSLLEIAENILKKKNKRRKRTKKRRVVQFDSDDSHIDNTRAISLSSSDSSSDKEKFSNKRKRLLPSSESSSEEQSRGRNRPTIKKINNHLLTSESDSDVTDIGD